MFILHYFTHPSMSAFYAIEGLYNPPYTMTSFIPLLSVKMPSAGFNYISFDTNTSSSIFKVTEIFLSKRDCLWFYDREVTPGQRAHQGDNTPVQSESIRK